MTHVSRDEFNRLARLQRDRAAAKKSKRDEKRQALPWGQRLAVARRRTPSLFKVLALRLDSLWGLLVRTLSIAKYGNVCRIQKARRCAGVVECGYHLLSKARGHAVRWCLEAGVGACNACNDGERHNRQLYGEYHEQIFGRDFMDRLRVVARQTVDLDASALRDKIADFKRQIETLSQGGR